MYFIEFLCDMAKREGHDSYVLMMRRDIVQIIDAVTPADGSGAANIKVVRKVLQGLQSKEFLQEQTVSEIEECLKERDTHPDASSPLQADVEMTDVAKVSRTNGRSVAKLDKKQIEQRIEEDRERHKRLREHIWAIPVGGEEKEFSKLWEESSNLGDDDYLLYEEEDDAKQESITEW
jgi:CTD kinase subunit gamma